MPTEPIVVQTKDLSDRYFTVHLEKLPLHEEVSFDFSSEAHSYITNSTLEPTIYHTIHKTCEQLGRDPNTITYLSGNVYEAENYARWCEENNIEQALTVEFKQYWMYTVRDMHLDMSYLNNLNKHKQRAKYFTYFNRMARPNRLFFWEEMMSRSLTNDDIAVITAHWIDKTLDDGEYDVDYMNHSKELPQQFIDAHADTYFDVVTETLAGSPWSNSTHKPNPSWWQEIFFTEKTFRCIMNMRPFILFGNQHSLLKLKEWGFRTFDGVLWNEEYDWISNGEERAKAVAKTVEDFVVANSLQQVHRKVYSDEVQEILQHNRDRFLELTNSDYHWREVMNYQLKLSMQVEIDKQDDFPIIQLQNTDFVKAEDRWSIKKKLWSRIKELRDSECFMLDYSFEATSIKVLDEDLVHIYDLIYDNIEKLNDPDVTPDKLIYVTGNQYEYDNYKNWIKDNPDKIPFRSVSGRQTQIPATYYCEDLSYTSEGGMFKSKYALTMHRRPGAHRVQLLNQMWRRGLIDDSKCISKFNWDWQKHQTVIPESPNELHTLLPKNTPEDDQVCYSEDYPAYYKQMFADTYISIESETQADLHLETAGRVIKELYPYWQRMYFTEKIWRNIYWKRPFLLIGDYGMLDQLKEYGFKSLHGILWDESYDLEPNWEKRIDMMLDQYEYILHNYTLEQLHNKIYSKEVQDILEFNRKEFIKLAKGHK